ncbi:hypothetical protein LMG33818_001082 [Halomonadaceae bacterium LMG 33818]
MSALWRIFSLGNNSLLFWIGKKAMPAYSPPVFGIIHVLCGVIRAGNCGYMLRVYQVALSC